VGIDGRPADYREVGGCDPEWHPTGAAGLASLGT